MANGAIEIPEDCRGREITPTSWRNFCCTCGIPLVVHAEWMRLKKDMCCRDCASGPKTGGPLATAFSAEKKGY
jgi:hypothetical protein